MAGKNWAAVGFGLLFALTGCGGGDETGQRKQGDAALSAALDDPVMVDPGLGGQDQADAGLTAALPGSSAVPPIDRSKAVIDEARAQALRLAGGKLSPAPSGETGDAGAPGFTATTAEQLVSALRGVGSACVQSVRYSAVWAARFPAALPPYPRSNVIEAAGSDGQGCRLRAARFVTPVSRQDVVDFYHARLRATGGSLKHQEVGGRHLLTQTGAKSAYLVRVRETEEGLVELSLASRD